MGRWMVVRLVNSDGGCGKRHRSRRKRHAQQHRRELLFEISDSNIQGVVERGSDELENGGGEKKMKKKQPNTERSRTREKERREIEHGRGGAPAAANEVRNIDPWQARHTS
jgi:hypothetical protein